MNYQSIDYEKLCVIVKDAGKLLLTFYNGSFQVHKKSKYAMYTDADIASEKFLKKELTNLFDCGVWAEESGKTENGNYCWVIDPLDGTANFARKLPYFCVSVALTHKDVPVIGIVYQPITDELFFTIKGEKPTCNGVEIAVTKKNNFSDTMLGVSSWGNIKEYHVTEILKKRAVVRRHGAIALDLAYVAAGRLDAFFYSRAYWWDVAAGRLLIESAGGKVSSIKSISKKGAVTGGIASGKSLFSCIKSMV